MFLNLVQHTLKQTKKRERLEKPKLEFQIKQIESGLVKKQKVLFAPKVAYYQEQNGLDAHPRIAEEPVTQITIRVTNKSSSYLQALNCSEF